VTAPPPKKPIVTCASKRRHPDELTARAAASLHLERKEMGDELFVYRCPICDGWHLTGNQQGAAAAVTAGDPFKERKYGKRKV
jgi:hypothetical protein